MKQTQFTLETGVEAHAVIINHENGNPVNVVFKPALHALSFDALNRFAEQLAGACGQIAQDFVNDTKAAKAAELAAKAAELEAAMLAEREAVLVAEAAKAKMEAEKLELNSSTVPGATDPAQTNSTAAAAGYAELNPDTVAAYTAVITADGQGAAGDTKDGDPGRLGIND